MIYYAKVNKNKLPESLKDGLTSIKGQDVIKCHNRATADFLTKKYN